jgi:hypothetical protein
MTVIPLAMVSRPFWWIEVGPEILQGANPPERDETPYSMLV